MTSFVDRGQLGIVNLVRHEEKVLLVGLGV
jgi:hypothetical protein